MTIWNLTTNNWDIDPQLWNEVALILQEFKGVGTSSYKRLIKKLDKKSREKLIRILCIINNERFEKEIEINDYQIKVEDIKLLLKEQEKIKISAQMISETIN